MSRASALHLIASHRKPENGRAALAVIEHIGIVGGGYFQTELRKLDGEIVAMDQAIGVGRGLGPDDKPLPLTVEQESWWKAAWLPFFRSWKGFYEDYAYGWKSVNFPISTSRVEQMEDYRKQFLELRHDGERLYHQITMLPDPTPIKTYTSLWEDAVNAIIGMFKWILIFVGVGVGVYILIRRFGG